MIGKICKAHTPYYNVKSKRMSFKSRPALVLARADTNDFVVLPVSTITYKENIDPVYDVPIDPSKYPNTNLLQVSYVRTHKQTTVHEAELTGVICDLKHEYPDLYIEILDKRESFSQEITNQAL